MTQNVSPIVSHVAEKLWRGGPQQFRAWIEQIAMMPDQDMQALAMAGIDIAMSLVQARLERENNIDVTLN